MSKSTTLTLDLYPVTIRRSKEEVIGGLFPKHEIAVLRAIHPNKVDVGKEPEDDREYSISAEGEFARLLKAYNRVNSPNPVPAVFPGREGDLEQFGFETGRSDIAQGAESLAVNHKANAKKAAADKAKTEKPSAK